MATNTVHQELWRNIFKLEESNDDNDQILQNTDTVHYCLVLETLFGVVLSLVPNPRYWQNEVPQVEIANPIHNALVQGLKS